MRKLKHLGRHGALDAMDLGDPVTDRYDGADLCHIDVDGVVADLVANDLGNLVRFDGHRQKALYRSNNVCRIRSR